MEVTVRLPKLYIHVRQATHFLRWERDEFAKYFELVSEPSEDVPLLSFGPDVLEEASELPASKRFAVLFPGFRHNPVYNLENRELHHRLIKNHFTYVFINPGPLEIAYKGLDNIVMYPFSVDTNLVKFKRYRRAIKSILHVSSDSPQKDWQRSEAIMKKTGLRYEVYPPRDPDFFSRITKNNITKNKIRNFVGLRQKKYLPLGYVDHSKVVRKYQKYDAFIHVAKDIKDPNDGVDGKYTAAFIEAGLTGAIMFWHDTYGLGNGLKTVFELPLDPDEAALRIIQISKKINIKKHSKETRKEMLRVFNPQDSVKTRAKKILKSI